MRLFHRHTHWVKRPLIPNLLHGTKNISMFGFSYEGKAGGMYNMRQILNQDLEYVSTSGILLHELKQCNR